MPFWCKIGETRLPPMQKKSAAKPTSSEIMPLLFGDIARYCRIMEKWAKYLSRKYPNKNLAAVFSKLAHKVAVIGPMILCKNVVQDLGQKCPEQVLAAVGLACLSISTHDDVVDERPQDREEIASLVYAGNIAGLEAVSLLKNSGYTKILVPLSAAINKNHYLQQFRVDLLWSKKPKNFRDYQFGIADICSWVAIGPKVGLSLTGRSDLANSISEFIENYGIAIQLIDDIREVEEDRLSGYNSFPLLEGKPYKRSFKELDKCVERARNSLGGRWRNLQNRALLLERFVDELKKGYL